MKIRKQERLAHRVTALPGDMVSVHVDGEKVIEDTITESMVLTEAITFDVEAEDFGLNRRGIGAALLTDG